jgi:hypothetical protein
MPGWKRDVGRRLDALIVRTIPGVHKAVKWNSPFYGIEGQGWFLSYHCFTKYIKVAFFRGTSLHPLPPAASKHKNVRYLDIHEDDQLDEAQLAAWVKQASQLPGERMWAGSREVRALTRLMEPITLSVTPFGMVAPGPITSTPTLSAGHVADSHVLCVLPAPLHVP